MAQLLLASSNRGKLREIQALLKDLDLELVTPGDLGLELVVEEDGASYTENASLKAQVFARASGQITLADDSGLEVDVLGGLPGIRSARFSPLLDATDADRRQHLIEQLRGKSRPWKAHFHCVMAIAKPAGEIHLFEGICHGEVIPEERGHDGFGYDPIFLFPDLGLTMAELTMGQKNRLSHRAKAILASRPFLMKLLRRPL